MSEFVDHLSELMAGWAIVQPRRMFGGYGLYRDGLMFALVADETLYFKIDAVSQAQFEQAGSAPFVFTSSRSPQRKPSQMSYWSAPPECLESATEMHRWCELGYAAALRARRSPTKRRTR